MNIKKIFQQYTAEELSEGLVFPVEFSDKQQKQADIDLAEARKKSLSEMTEDQKLHARLLQLRFQLEDYLQSDAYDPALTFGHFLDLYLQLMHKKKKDFAKEIQIHETLLSHLINNRREPNDSIMIRLELHSNKVIPAINWYKLAEKEKEYQIRTDNSLRDKESKYVIRGLQPTV